jgi:hypothetical protein
LRGTITKEGRDFNTEERAEWEKANKDFDRLDSMVQSVERADKLARLWSRATRTTSRAPSRFCRAPRTWFRRTSGTAGRRGQVAQLARSLALQALVYRAGAREAADRRPADAGVRSWSGLDAARPVASNIKPVPQPGRGPSGAVHQRTTTAGGYTVPTRGSSTSLEVRAQAVQRRPGGRRDDAADADTGNPLRRGRP